MATVECEVTIQASPDVVYQVSQDYSVRYQWDPFPEKIELLESADRIEKGTKAFIRAKNGLKMVVEFVQVSPPSTAAIRMVHGPIFLESFAGSWIFKVAGPGITKARFIYSIKSKRWAVPYVLDRVVCWYFRRVILNRLLGLKNYCEKLS